jgi:hypothetical protein
MNIKIFDFLRPKYKTKLQRIGRTHDGGYCFPEESIKKTRVLYSAGLNDDWSFEKYFLSKNENVKIITFDKSVNIKFWIKHFILNTIDLIKFKKNLKQFLTDAFSFFKYKLFFNKKNILHIKKNIVESDRNQNINEDKFSTSIRSIISKYGNKDFSMKIDIEGNEFRIMRDILDNQEGLECLVMELHNVDLMKTHIKSFVENLKLDLVHIHVNNFGGTNNEGFAKVIEVTFSKRKYNKVRDNDEFEFPDMSIDQSNDPNLRDLKVKFEN